MVELRQGRRKLAERRSARIEAVERPALDQPRALLGRENGGQDQAYDRYDIDQRRGRGERRHQAQVVLCVPEP